MKQAPKKPIVAAPKKAVAPVKKPVGKAPVKAVTKIAPKAPVKVAPVKAAKPAPKAPAKKPAQAETKRHAEGRDCARYQDYNGCVIPRIRPPRNMPTPEGFDYTKWTEKEGRGCPSFAVRDCYNVAHLRNADGDLRHTPIRSLAVSGVLANSTVEGMEFDPAARHNFVVVGDTFIVW